MFHVKHCLHDALTRRERHDGGNRAAVAVGYVRLAVQRADGHGPQLSRIGESDALTHQTHSIPTDMRPSPRADSIDNSCREAMIGSQGAP